jgi:photosystem II stability/assembly factor-like uncharacterized protein
MLKKIFQISSLTALILVLSGCSALNKPIGGFLKSVNGGDDFFQEEGEESSVLNGSNILSLEINPNNNQEIFVGTAKQGLFKTIDEGKSWLADVNGFESVYDLEIVPNTSVIYMAATKEGRSKLFKSENNGDGWLEIYTEKDQTSHLTSVAVHEKKPGTVYITNSKGGLFKSEDGGATWKNLYWAKSSIRKIEIDKINPDIFYLVTESSGLVRSQDGGEEDFEAVIENSHIYNIAVHPNRERFVYVSAKNGLQRSLNGGSDWDMVSTLVKAEEMISRGIAINPQNPKEIYFTAGLTFYRSSNEGETWATTQFNFNAPVEIIKINPSNTQKIYLGTNRGGASFKLQAF